MPDFLGALSTPPAPTAPPRAAPVKSATVIDVVHLPAAMCPKCPPPRTVVIFRDTPAVRTAFGLVSAAAMGVSYSKNKSVPWAFLHGLIGPAYLFYVGAQALQERQKRGSSDWWTAGVAATARGRGTTSIGPFESDDEEAAWEVAWQKAEDLGFNDFPDMEISMDTPEVDYLDEADDPRLMTLGGPKLPPDLR